MKKFVVLAMVTALLLSSCPVLSLLGIGGDDKQTQDQVELRLNLNGGTGTTATVPKINPGQTATTPTRPTGWTYTGHQFIGWNTAADGGGDGFQPGDPITMLSNLTLYAQWRALGHPYSVSELDSRLNGLTARLLVFEEDYDITSALGADGPPEETLAFGYTVISNRTIGGNLWKYEGWIDDPDPDDPNMLPWQPSTGVSYDVYILVEFEDGAPELVAGAGSSVSTYTINPLATFTGTTSWTLTANTEVYLEMDQGHSYNITNFASEWNGELAMVMVFPGDLVLADAVGSDEPPTLAALGFGTITGNSTTGYSLTGGLYQAPSWEDIDNPEDIDRIPWFPAVGDEDYLVAVMLPNWNIVFFGAGTNLEIQEVNPLASGLTREMGPWDVSMFTAVEIDMDNDSGQKYKVSDFDPQYADQDAIMLVVESPVDWPTLMDSGGDGTPPDGILAFGWRWIDEYGTVSGGLYRFGGGPEGEVNLETYASPEEIWDSFGTGYPGDGRWVPWYPDSAKEYELVMVLPHAALVFFGAGTKLDLDPPAIFALAVKPGSEPRWRLSASGAVTMDMEGDGGGGGDGGGDQEPLVLTSIAGIYSESRTIQGDPSFSNENGLFYQQNSSGSHPVVEGSYAMLVEYNLPDWEGDGGFPWLHINYGRPCNITAITDLVFSIDKAQLTSLHSMTVILWSGEGGGINSSVQLSAYTPTTSMDHPYSTYRIPLTDFDAEGLDRFQLYSISIGWPVDDTGEPVEGTVYFDDIYFE